MKLTTIKSLAAAALCAVGLSSFAAEPEAVQLWEGGPYWATVNVGADKPEDCGTYSYFADAPAEVAKLGQGWRLPTKDEFQKLIDNSVCEREWDSEKKGCLFTSKADSSKSIFFPAAGKNSGFGPRDVGTGCYYWSATEDPEDQNTAYSFNCSSAPNSYSVHVESRDTYLSVRAVRDTPLPPTVTVDKVESADPWDSAKGTIKVDYTLGGVDAKLDYKVAFDVMAGGQTASVTNDAAKVTDGAATKEIDTATLFGKEVVDTKAKVKISLIAIKPKGLASVQLWDGGPFWAECNVGADTPEGYGILAKFDDAAKAVADAMGTEWRVPSDTEWKALITNCGKGTWTEQNGVYGRLFKGTGNCESNSIFLPAAGYEPSAGRTYDGSYGYYWSSSVFNSDKGYRLTFYDGDAGVASGSRIYGLSVRAVRDAK